MGALQGDGEDLARGQVGRLGSVFPLGVFEHVILGQQVLAQSAALKDLLLIVAGQHLLHLRGVAKEGRNRRVGRPNIYAAGRFRVAPEWYALLLARELLGTRPLPTAMKVRPQVANVQANGFLAADGSLSFVLVDYDPLGKPAVSARLRVGAGYSRASTLALTGQSLHALSGAELGESEVGGDGSWKPRRFGTLAARGGTVTVKLPAASAVLVRVSPDAKS